MMIGAAVPAVAKPPKLTVFITVDAFGSDVFMRSRPKLKGGLATMVRDGATFPTARYDFAETVTAAGHTTLVTGANPARHGINSNRIFNRATGKLDRVFADPNHPVLEAPLSSDDVSPVNLLAETLSDRLRLATQARGKSIAIAGKARSSIALGGRLGEAWWFSEEVGKFVTGTYYRKEFPAWVKAFNDKKLPETWFTKEWALLEPVKEYIGDDERTGESDWYALGKKFPHPLNGGLAQPGPQAYSALASSPMFNELQVAFAKAAIEAEALGKDDIPDLLSVSFSALDRTYHLWGPYSWEMQDHVLRLDKSIGELIAAAEKAAGGRANLLVVLSADHGGANIPEQWAASGVDGVRVNPGTLLKGLEKELAGKFNGGVLVSAMEEIDVYLDQKAIADKKLDLTAVRRFAAAWLARQPDVALAVAREDLNGVDPSPGWLPFLRAGFHPDRSGDVLVVLKPGRVHETEVAGTSHGSPYSYDAMVPVLLLGRGVKAGYYPRDIRVVDVAPTVAALMEMLPPSQSEGEVRDQAISISGK
ncbi:MAG: Alkaline phosphatase [Myxococcaceae bacterium]|nr:Alkaline phosphatase [Myxococcaceae bacterium]